MGPLCTGLIRTWFRSAVSRHNLTLPFALGTSPKLLQHSNVLLTPRGVIIPCCCSLSSLSCNGFCSAYVTHLGSAWYSLLSGLSCKENMPSKHPLPLKTASKSLCICCVDSALFLLSLSYVRPPRKYSVDLLAFTSAFSFVLLLADYAVSVYTALTLSISFLSWFWPLDGMCVCIPVTITGIFSTYSMNIYWNYVEYICIWHAQ